jgi:hypothetical protein
MVQLHVAEMVVTQVFQTKLGLMSNATLAQLTARWDVPICPAWDASRYLVSARKVA